MERLATLGTTFGQNVLADEASVVFALTEAEVDGLPDFARASAAETARDRKLNAPFAATTSRSSVEPILHFATDRSVREKVWRAFVNRGHNGNAHDNRKVIAEMVGPPRRAGTTPRLRQLRRLQARRFDGQDPGSRPEAA